MRKRPLIERLINKTKISTSGKCCIFTGGINSSGYGSIGYLGRTISAHRAAWIVYNGSIPEGLSVLHKCDNRRCVNPDHLFLGDNNSNVQDKVSKGRQHHPAGKLNGRSKIDSSDADRIRKIWNIGGIKKSEIAKMFKINKTTVGKIIKGELWK